MSSSISGKNKCQNECRVYNYLEVFGEASLSWPAKHKGRSFRPNIQFRFPLLCFIVFAFLGLGSEAVL